MKIGFTLMDYFPYGGLQRDCLRTAEICAARGHEVTIFTQTWQGERPPGVAVELIGRRGLSNHARTRHFAARLTRRLSVNGLHGLVGFNRLPGLDLYYAADPCFAAKMARSKPAWYRWLPRYRQFLFMERAVFSAQSRARILLLTSAEIPIFQERYGTPIDRFRVLPPGIPRLDSSEEARRQARAKVFSLLGASKNGTLLLFVGSNFRGKGLDLVLRGLAALPEPLGKSTRLAVLGQDDPRRYAKLAVRLGVSTQVHFLGGRDDVSDFLLAADLLVHPSHGESAGMVLLEALTAGLPVLTRDTCGYAFHVENAEAGRVLPSPFRQPEFNEALREMIRGGRRSYWRANALQYAAREDLYRCHEIAADIIEDTLRKKKENNNP